MSRFLSYLSVAGAALIGLAALASLYLAADNIAIIAANLGVEPVSPAFADRDFANYWMAGRLVLSGETADLFGPQPGYFRHLTDVFGADYGWHNWSYPPTYLFFVAWTGLLSYSAAMLVFLVVSLVLFVWGARVFAGPMTGSMTVMAWICLLPIIAHNIETAQNGFLTAGLALASLGLRRTRPVAAGILIGLLAFKPQLGIVYPVLLLAERRWAVIGAAAATVLVTGIVSLAVFGRDAWSGYLANVVPYQSTVMATLEGVFNAMLTSVFGAMRNWGEVFPSAIATHLALAGPLGLAGLVALFRVQDDDDRAIIAILTTLVITPYALSYDLGILAGAMALLVSSRARSGHPLGLPWRELTVLTATLPILMIPAGRLGLPLAPVLIALMLVKVLADTGAFAGMTAGNSARTA